MKVGTVNISRGIWDDPAFKEQPFTEREAFMWMVMEAAWEPRERNLKGHVVALSRGQLLASVRFMAEAWNWQKSTVARFLLRLKNRDMIGVESGTLASVITIRNYDKYQFDPSGRGTVMGQKAGHARDSRGTVVGQKNILTKIEEFKQDTLPIGRVRARDDNDELFPEDTGGNADDKAEQGPHHQTDDAEAQTTDPGPAEKRPAGDRTDRPKDKRPPAKRKTQFPANWQPTEAGKQYAVECGCPDLAANAAACVDTHRGNGRTFLDHDAAWRTWCRNARDKFGWHGGDKANTVRNGGNGGGYSNAGDRAREAGDRMLAARARASARRRERDRTQTDDGWNDAMPVIDFASYRSG